MRPSMHICVDQFRASKMPHVVAFSAWLVGLALCFSVSIGVEATYPVTRINASALITDTKIYTIETSDGTLIFNYKSPRTGQPTGDKFMFKLFGLQDQRFRFKQVWNDTICQVVGTGAETLNNWTTLHEPGPSGTLNITAIGRFSGSCMFIASFLFTNDPVNVTFGNNTVEIVPHRAKLTIVIRCPWRKALDHFGIAYADTAQIMGRIIEFDALMRFTHSTQLSGDLLLIKSPPTNRIPWTNWVEGFCRDILLPENSPMVPVHRDPNIFQFVFDFGVVTDLLEWKVELLSYGFSDDFNISSVELDMTLYKGYNPESVNLEGGLRFELADHIEYDPTFDLIFRGDDGTPPSASGPPPAVIQEVQQINITAIAIGVVVGIIVIAVVVVFLTVPAVRAAILPYSVRRGAAEITSNPNDYDELKLVEASSPHAKSSPAPSSSWVPSNTPTAKT